MLFLTLILAVIMTSIHAGGDIEVIDLDRESLFPAIKDNRLLFVFFFDKNDGVTERQLIELFKAGNMLKKGGETLKIGRYEGQVTPRIENTLKVFKFPKLIFFNEGKRVPYNGGKMSRQIYSWVKR